MSLEDDIRSAFASGRDRILLRVSRRAQDGTPEAFQCHIQSEQNMHLRTLVGIRANPVAALAAALRDEPIKETPAPPEEDIFG